MSRAQNYVRGFFFRAIITHRKQPLKKGVFAMLFLLFTTMIFGISTSGYAQEKRSNHQELFTRAELGNVAALKRLLDDSKKDAQFETARWALDRLEIRIAQEAGCNNEEAQKIKKELFSPTKIDKNEKNFLLYLAKISSQERSDQRNTALEWAELNLTKNYGQCQYDTEILLKKQEILQQMQKLKIEKIVVVPGQEKPVLKQRNSFYKIYEFFKGRVPHRRNTI